MTAASASSAEDERASAADDAALSAAPSPQLPARGCAPPESPPEIREHGARAQRPEQQHEENARRARRWGIAIPRTQSGASRSEGSDGLTQTGVEIVVDPTATAVSSSFVAETPPKGLPPLRPPYLSVTDKNGVIDVHCVRGQLDCSTLTVTIPSGTPSEPLRLTVESSKYGVHASGATATVASLVVRSTGHGDVAFDVAPTLGASIDITSSGNLMDVTLPPDLRGGRGHVDQT